MNSDVKHKKNVRFVALKIWELLFIRKLGGLKVKSLLDTVIGKRMEDAVIFN